MFGSFVLGGRGFYPSETTDWSCDATRSTVSFTSIGTQIPIRNSHKTYELKDIYLRLKKKGNSSKAPEAKNEDERSDRFLNGSLCISFVGMTFTICTSPTIHLVCLCFLISPGYYSNIQEKLKTIFMQSFGEKTRVYYGRCADGEFTAS